QKSPRVPPTEGVEFARFAEFFVCVDLDGLQQPIGNRVATDIGGDHRLGNEIGKGVQNRLFRQLVITDHFNGLIDAEVSREDAEPPQRDLFVGGEQTITPIKSRAKRLLSGQCIAWTSREQGEAIIQAPGDGVNVEKVDACCRKFDCQRYAIESPADV